MVSLHEHRIELENTFSNNQLKFNSRYETIDELQMFLAFFLVVSQYVSQYVSQMFLNVSQMWIVSQLQGLTKVKIGKKTKASWTKR